MLTALRQPFRFRLLRYLCAAPTVLALQLCLTTNCLDARATPNSSQSQHDTPLTRQVADDSTKVTPNLQTSQEWNHRLKELLDADAAVHPPAPQDYRIGFDDVLDINVFEAQELNREVRVSSAGEISLPLLESVHVAGLTPRELELVLQELLRRTYMKDPHVSVFVREMQSHPVSVLGAVRKPGVFQVRGSKTLLEILSLAEGLADDAGETVIIMRGAGLQKAAGSEAEMSPSAKDGAGTENSTATGTNQNDSTENIVQVNLKDLLDSSDVHHNPLVNPGDIVKVLRAGIVYVVGEVQRPGGFTMKSNEKMSVLQVIALGGGLTRTASKSGARIIRTDEQSGEREQTPIDLNKILAGKAPDPMLEPKDIVFVPNSATKTTFSRGVEVAAQTLTGLLIFHW
jgi:polysaccharide export outer membrane protein